MLKVKDLGPSRSGISVGIGTASLEKEGAIRGEGKSVSSTLESS
jgi:hypothetical protein